MKQRILAILAYLLPTFPLGYFWHLATFADYYKSLEVYRDELIIPLGVRSMLIQGVAWSVIYERMFAGEPIWRGAMKFALLAAPIAWSFMVLAVGAKHRMASVSGFVLIETAFIAVQYAVVSPLLATVYARKPAI
jgi:hypothetical protein